MNTPNKDVLETRIKDEIYYSLPIINHGGCGVFAYELAKILMERGEVDIEILNFGTATQEMVDAVIEEYGTELSLNGINKILFQQKYDFTEIADHIFVRWGNMYIDGRGVYTAINEVPNYYGNHLTILPFDLVASLIKYPDGWNRVYVKNFNSNNDLVRNGLNKVITELYTENNLVD